ncbi:hypothetical protein TNCV_3136201 [Trichonephila clavipes]|nr:hypothetical protein TNCV_3136201 [Trichonephila clavipes]
MSTWFNSRDRELSHPETRVLIGGLVWALVSKTRAASVTQTYPRYNADARLVTQDTAYRILCRENLQLAERLSNALDSGYAIVQELPPYNETMEATREIVRENSEATRERDETIEATREMNRESPQEIEETMEVGEMADAENGIEAGEDQMAGGENGKEAVEDENAAGENGIEPG